MLQITWAVEDSGSGSVQTLRVAGGGRKSGSQTLKGCEEMVHWILRVLCKIWENK